MQSLRPDDVRSMFSPMVSAKSNLWAIAHVTEEGARRLM